MKRKLAWYWNLGDKATVLKKRDGLTWPKLAAKLKVEQTTVRLATKFAKRATKKQVNALQQKSVASRSIMEWIQVSDADSDKLYKEMLGGLTNSSDIRRYRENTLKKSTRPKLSQNVAKACLKVQTESARLVDVLEEFERMHADCRACLSGKALRDLSGCLARIDRMIRSTRKLIA